MSDTCSTCQEPYSKVTTERASICSNSFHLCRNCTWENGKRTAGCVDHSSSVGWTFSVTEEDWSHFGGHASADDAASHAVDELELQPGDTFYVGFASPINYADLADSINGSTIIESLQGAAYDMWNYEDALDSVSTEQEEELEAAFRKAFTDWVAKHKFSSGHYTIDNVKKHMVPLVESAT